MLCTEATYGTPQIVSGHVPLSRASREATLTVADLLRKYGPTYLARCGDEVDDHIRHVLTKLMQCRTEALGGHAWQCEACGHRHYAFNSCNNRHCTTCCRAPQLRWIEKQREFQLPVCQYHVVFTVPHELCDLILVNRGPLFSLLMRCSADTLMSLGREQLDAQMGVVTALHSWGQQMLPHPHSHNIVTPGGLSLDETHWVDASETFLEVDDLAERFRKLYLRGIERLYRRGELTMPDSMQAITNRDALRAWLAPLRRKRWMVDCQPPPVDCPDSEAVLKYLAKYVAGSVIHDWRIVSDDGEWVTFRIKNYREGTRELIRIRGQEFVRRFCLHILPQDFHRSRNCGLFAPCNRKTKLPLCRKLLGLQTEMAGSEEVINDDPDSSDHDSSDPDSSDHDANGHDTNGHDSSETEEDLEDKRTKKRCPRCLVWAMVWLQRLTTAERLAFQAQDQRLGKLLLCEITTLDVDRPVVLKEWRRELRELHFWPLQFW